MPAQTCGKLAFHRIQGRRKGFVLVRLSRREARGHGWRRTDRYCCDGHGQRDYRCFPHGGKP